MEIKPTEHKVVKPLHCALTQAEFNVKALEYAKVDDEVDTLEAERELSCTWHSDWASKSMLLRRDDTGEVVEARTMTPEEVQMNFDLSPEDKRLPPRRQDDVPDEDGVIDN